MDEAVPRRRETRARACTRECAGSPVCARRKVNKFSLFSIPTRSRGISVLLFYIPPPPLRPPRFHVLHVPRGQVLKLLSGFRPARTRGRRHTPPSILLRVKLGIIACYNRIVLVDASVCARARIRERERAPTTT